MQSFSLNLSKILLSSSFPNKPTVYHRYIDDIFMIWAHGIDKFKQFFNNANNTHRNITFTYEAYTALPFLVVLIIINKNNTIYTIAYSKPTDRHNYLNYKGNHPIHLTHSIYFFQISPLLKNMFRPQRLHQMQQGTYSSLFDEG